MYRAHVPHCISVCMPGKCWHLPFIVGNTCLSVRRTLELSVAIHYVAAAMVSCSFSSSVKWGPPSSVRPSVTSVVDRCRGLLLPLVYATYRIGGHLTQCMGGELISRHQTAGVVCAAAGLLTTQHATCRHNFRDLNRFSWMVIYLDHWPAAKPWITASFVTMHAGLLPLDQANYGKINKESGLLLLFEWMSSWFVYCQLSSRTFIPCQMSRSRPSVIFLKFVLSSFSFVVVCLNKTILTIHKCIGWACLL